MSIAEILDQTVPVSSGPPAWSSLNVAALSINGNPVTPTGTGGTDELAYFDGSGHISANANVTVDTGGDISTAGVVSAASLTLATVPVLFRTAVVFGTWVSSDFTTSPMGSITVTQFGNIITLQLTQFSATTVTSPSGVNLLFSGSLPFWAFPATLDVRFSIQAATGGLSPTYQNAVLAVTASGAVNIAPLLLSSGTWAGTGTTYTFYATSVSAHIAGH